jgi:hypothetical protein
MKTILVILLFVLFLPLLQAAEMVNSQSKVELNRGSPVQNSAYPITVLIVLSFML